MLNKFFYLLFTFKEEQCGLSQFKGVRTQLEELEEELLRDKFLYGLIQSYMFIP